MAENSSIHAAFVGHRRVASGPLREVLTVLKQRFDKGEADSLLVFELNTGRQIDFNLRGSIDEVLEREAPSVVRGPGRPRLGVVSREVTLLPRHWDWLEQQNSGISAAIRRLVEQAIKSQPGRERARRLRAGLSRFLSAMAGDRANYEEACRALFAGDVRLERLIEDWPKDIRDYTLHVAGEAATAETEVSPGTDAGARTVTELYRVVWSFGDYGAIERLVAPQYTIHSDPGDAWEGETLDRGTYAKRVQYSRNAFPDLAFVLDEVLQAGERIAVRWHAEGTHDGDLRGLPATGKRVTFSGQTFYELKSGQVAGHWQVVDRLGFSSQVRPPRARASQ